jgi:hypothetical protein
MRVQKKGGQFKKYNIILVIFVKKMSNFDQIDSDFTPLGVVTMAISWLNILGIVVLNPLLQTIVYLMTIIWLGMQMYGFIKKHFVKHKNNGNS